MNQRLYSLLASLALILLCAPRVSAQDDLLAELEADQRKPVIEGSFNTIWLVNTPTTTTVGKKDLLLSFMHRFGPVGGAGGGVQTLFGLDNIYDYRLSAYYGLTDHWHIGVGRSKVAQRFDFTTAYRFFDQRIAGFPASVTLHLTAAYASEAGGAVINAFNQNVERYPTLDSRWSYVVQLAIARKFGRRFTLLLVPTLLHRNYRLVRRDENTLFALGIGTRLRLTNKFTIMADYVQTFSPYRYLRLDRGDYFGPLSAGFEFEAGGHVFQFYLNNAAVMPHENLVNSPNRWDLGQMGMGFNIVRVIGLKRAERRPPPIPTAGE